MRADLEKVCFGFVAHLHIHPQLRTEIIRLLQGVFADFRRAVRHPGGHGKAKRLRPQFRAVNHIEGPGRTGNCRVPILDTYGGGDAITALPRQLKIRRQIHALGGHLRRTQIKFTLHRHVGFFDDHRTARRFHTKRQPARVRAQMQRLAGTIRDAHRRRQGFAGQELFLIQHHVHGHLRRRAEPRQPCQP